MHTKKTSAQLKQAARGIMLGKYRNAISILLASDLIINTISVMSATSNESYVGIIIGLAISFILVLLGAILNVGQCSFYLNVACNQKYEFSNLFTGFKVHPDKIIITQVIIQLLTILPLLPAIGVMWYSFKAYNIIVVFLIGCLLLILGAGLSWWISLRYSQIYFLLLDFPDYSTKELLKMSWRIMKGHCGRFLYLQVSFLPLMLAGFVSLGVGFLLIRPYQYMTYTLFYLDLIQE